MSVKSLSSSLFEVVKEAPNYQRHLKNHSQKKILDLEVEGCLGQTLNIFVEIILIMNLSFQVHPIHWNPKDFFKIIEIIIFFFKFTLLRINGLGSFFISKGIPSGKLSISGINLPFLEFLLTCLTLLLPSFLYSLSSLVGHKSTSGINKLHGDDGWFGDEMESSLRSLCTSLTKSIGLTSRLLTLPVDLSDFLELRFITIPLTLLHADLLFLLFSDGECCDPYVKSPSSEWLRRSSSWNNGARM